MNNFSGLRSLSRFLAVAITVWLSTSAQQAFAQTSVPEPGPMRITTVVPVVNTINDVVLEIGFADLCRALDGSDYAGNRCGVSNISLSSGLPGYLIRSNLPAMLTARFDAWDIGQLIPGTHALDVEIFWFDRPLHITAEVQISGFLAQLNQSTTIPVITAVTPGQSSDGTLGLLVHGGPFSNVTDILIGGSNVQSWRHDYDPVTNREVIFLDAPQIIPGGTFELRVTRTIYSYGSYPEVFQSAPFEFSMGVQGPKGDPGEPGPKGDRGDIGPQGETGSAGPKGDTGAAGPKGDIGTTGPKGDTGATGAQGPQGLPGSQGAQGPIGPKGDTGATGAQGPEGPPGPTGSGFTGMREFDKPGEYVQNLPSHVTSVIAEVWGAGGGGSQASSTKFERKAYQVNGAGGGSGAYCKGIVFVTIDAVTKLPSVTVRVGDGGKGGSSGGLATDGLLSEVFSKNRLFAGGGLAANVLKGSIVSPGGQGGSSPDCTVKRPGRNGTDGSPTVVGIGGEPWIGSIEPVGGDGGNGGVVPTGDGAAGAAGYVILHW